MPIAEGRRPTPLTVAEIADLQQRSRERHIVRDHETAQILLNQLCLRYDGMPIHGLLIRDDSWQVVTRSVAENGESLPSDDFLASPMRRTGKFLRDLVQCAKVVARGQHDHLSVANEVVVIDRTTNKSTFGLSELTGLEKTDYGWVGTLNGQLNTRVHVVSRRLSAKGIAELTP